MTQPRVNPHIIIAIGVLGTSFAAIFVRWSSSTPLLLAFYRLFFTLCIITPIFLYLRGWRHLRTLPVKNVLIIIGAGFFYLDWSFDATTIILVVAIVVLIYYYYRSYKAKKTSGIAKKDCS